MQLHRRQIGAVVAAIAAAGSAGGQSSLPRAPGARVVTLSPPGQTGTEEIVAVNRFSPNEVVAGYTAAGPMLASSSYFSATGPMVAYSTDSGRTFSIPQMVGPGGYGGNNSITFDDKGNVFLSYQLIEKLGTPGYWGHNAHGNGIWLRHSPDGGKRWDKDATPILVWPNGKPAPEQEDMARIWADNAPKSPYRGNLYLAWISWQIDKSVVLFTRSADAGKTWAKPWQISTHAGSPRDDTGGISGILGAVAADGTQYVVWNEGLHTILTISHDGGQTFSPSRPIIETGPPYFGGAAAFPGFLRVLGLPQVAVDETSGTVYVAWSDTRNGDVDVFLTRSADQGATWAPPLRVNDDPVHNGADQFYQWLAVDPTDGAVYLQFYDRRDDPENEKTTITIARSTDGGKTFTNYAWSAEPFIGHNTFLGDYPWLTVYGGRTYGAWAEAVADPKAMRRACNACGGALGSPAIIRLGVADFRSAR